MKFLKGFGTFVLGFLLFVSISTFSIAFLLNSTVLNPGFITRQVDRLDISAVARDVAEKQVADKLPAELGFLKDAVYSVIDAQEPWLKKQVNQAINASYDFFLGKTDQFKISVPMDAFKKDLKDSLWTELNKQLTPWLRDNIQSQLKPYIEKNLQAYRKSLPLEFAFLSDAQLKSYLDTYLKQIQDQIIKTGTSPDLPVLLETVVKPYFNEYYDKFAAEIPNEVTTGKIPANVMQQLEQVKKYIGYFRSGFYLLIVFMVILVAGIYLIHRNIQDPSRALGIDLLIYGVLDMLGAFAARSFNPATLLPSDVASLGTWLNGIYHDITGIMLTFSIVVLAIGVALLVVSFIFKKKVSESQAVK